MAVRQDAAVLLHEIHISHLERDIQAVILPVKLARIRQVACAREEVVAVLVKGHGHNPASGNIRICWVEHPSAGSTQNPNGYLGTEAACVIDCQNATCQHRKWVKGSFGMVALLLLTATTNYVLTDQLGKTPPPHRHHGARQCRCIERVRDTSVAPGWRGPGR